MHGMPRDQSHNVPARRSQRQTDPELTPPLDSCLRDQTVEAERREREAQDCQQAEHPREHPLLAQLTVDTDRQRSRL